MRVVTRYFVVSRYGTNYIQTMNLFVDAIDNMLADGWRLVGGIHYVTEIINDTKYVIFHQAMEKVFFEPIEDTEHGK